MRSIPTHQSLPGGISMSILDLYCSVDTFWQQFAPLWERELVAAGKRRRKRVTRLRPSEIMTILILFQQSGYRTFTGRSRAFLRNRFRSSCAPSFRSWSAPPALSRSCRAWCCRWRSTCIPPTGVMYQPEFCGLHRVARLPQCAHLAAPRLSGRCATRQDLGRRVLQLQVASGGQWPRRTAGRLPHPRQRG
ncbi:MAG: hypothetical protein OJF49_000315 [Ktedonobacterales bacterium]|nr:MAG: hypothetical protein OJF49_000315 [Ktedonobacterales bacterium]